MKKASIFFAVIILIGAISVSFKKTDLPGDYFQCYTKKIELYKEAQQKLLETIKAANTNTPEGLAIIKEEIHEARKTLKAIDFWTRYLEPVMYNKLNGPLPVEWETEVFEKFEKPYKREGAGLTLAELYLEENSFSKDSLVRLVNESVIASATYTADSITANLKNQSVFFLSNRLYLLNLAAIYTTGFECPDSNIVVPELQGLMSGVAEIYQAYNKSFPGSSIPDSFLSLYKQALVFVKDQPIQFSKFDHFTFIRDYVNPLFAINQQLIRDYKIYSSSFIDYTLNNTANSIFNKQLYNGQNSKGIFLRVKDEKALADLDKVGKMLFYDPILSGNNQRSCISCHKSTEYFTDTSIATSLQFNRVDQLTRNSPSLINANFNHLLMLDGKHISMQNQAKAVITNPAELNSNEKEIVEKVLSCAEYKKIFDRLLKYTPQETEITFDHIVSALTYYYTKFSNYYAPFDDAMNERKQIDAGVKHGFNLFMSKAQCATCHFVPEFNGVKPPYISSEFEVLGIPTDTTYKSLGTDQGRYLINPAEETMYAFRTGTVRNAAHTMPYMHNGIFKNLQQVIDFYDAGGGTGKGLKVPNQTLSADSLHLGKLEKEDLLLFISSLSEKIKFEAPPASLPLSANKKLNKRKVGGEY